MSSDWYCQIGVEEYGPLDAEELKQLARSGRLEASSPVRKGQDSNWVNAARVWGLFANDEPPKSQSSSPSELSDNSRHRGKRRVRVPYKSIVAASIVLATIGIAFYLGRQTASPAGDNRQPSKAALGGPVPVKTTEVTDRVATLTEAKATIPADANRLSENDAKIAESKHALSPPDPAQKNEFESAAAAREAIASAEKSVVLIEVKGRTRGDIGKGSGFLVSEKIVVTNYHVIEGANSVQVSFPGGRKVAASGWLAHNSEKDLAVIECDSSASPPLKLASDRPSKLDTVFAIGSPFGEFEGTVSSGIVSGIRIGKELGRDVVLIQTTAPISPGSSGGPLLNDQGEVVGVNTGSVVNGQSLNFAVAIEHVHEILRSASARSKAWRDLPEPRSRPANQPGFSPVAQWIAKQNAAAIEAARAKQAEVIARQGELDRIVVRAGDLAQAIALMETEGAALTFQRDRIHAKMLRTGVNARSKTVTANKLWDGGASATLFDNQPVNDAGTAATLRQQYDAICQQIDYKLQQRKRVLHELNTLRKRYSKLSRAGHF